MFEAMNLAILIGAGLVVASALTSLVAQRAGAPLLLVFLAMGLLAGEDGLLGIEFDSGPVTYFIGTLALAIILFDSGFETTLKSFRAAGGPALTLATFGVVLTMLFVGAAAHLLFDVGWTKGFLLGAIVASTDAAAVFFLLRVGGITLRQRVKATLEIESGSNDPMAIFLTALLADLVATPALADNLGWHLAASFLLQMGLGLVLGALGGFAIARALNRLGGLDPGLYPITALAAALILVGATGLVGGSGLLAAYVAGVVAGNSKVRFAPRLRRFQMGMTWLAQIGMFLALGLLATPSEFGDAILPALALAAVLIFVGRPLAVWLCLLPFGFSAREVAFVGWVGLRGAVSILLAIVPSLSGIPDGHFFFNVVFVMVLTSLLIQGWTIGFTARRLQQMVPVPSSLVDRVELELPGDPPLELVGYRIHPESAVARGERVPRWARPVLVVRDGRAFSVHGAGPLRPNDQAYLFASPRQVDTLDKVYAAPVEPDDPDVFGDFALVAETTLAELAHHYGAAADGAAPETSLGALLMREFHDQPAVGDRMTLGPVEIVVRALNEDADASVREVGIILQHPPRKRRAGRWLRRLLGEPG